jgi:hypothetical protein
MTVVVFVVFEVVVVLTIVEVWEGEDQHMKMSACWGQKSLDGMGVIHITIRVDSPYPSMSTNIDIFLWLF